MTGMAAVAMEMLAERILCCYSDMGSASSALIEAAGFSAAQHSRQHRPRFTCTINAAVSASGCSRSSADPAAAAAARLRMYSSRSPSISGICSTTAASPGLSLMASSSVLQLLAPPPSLLRSCELTRVAKASCTVRIDGSSDSAMWMCASRTAALSSDSPSPAAASAAVRAEQHLPAPGATAAGLAAAAERLPATAPPNDPGGAAGSQLRSDISFMAHGRPWRSCAVSMRPCELQMWRPRASLSNSSSRSYGRNGTVNACSVGEGLDRDV
eukprot:293811-Chlamydomonas_euryale.AAC.7